MSRADRSLDPSRVPGALLTEHCDCPADLTLAEWRRARAAQAGPPEKRTARLRRALRRRKG
jgi:hypothetical protein